MGNDFYNLPPGFEVKQKTDDQVQITWSFRNSSALDIIEAIISGSIGITLVLILFVPTFLFLPFALISITVSMPIIYTLVAMFINTTTISIDRQQFSLVRTPLPYLYSVHLHTREITYFRLEISAYSEAPLNPYQNVWHIYAKQKKKQVKKEAKGNAKSANNKMQIAQPKNYLEKQE